MYCPYCGTLNREGSPVCSNCKRELTVVPQREERPVPVTQPNQPLSPEWPPSRPFYPGQPGSQYSYAQPPNPGYYYGGPAYAATYDVDRVGVARADANFWTRFGAYLIDSIITNIINGVVIGIPLIIWAVNFARRYATDIDSACSGTRYRSAVCDNAMEDIMVNNGEIFSLLGLLLGFGLLATVLVVSYYVLMTARGATLGKKVFGLRVVQADGTPPGFGKALLRQTIGYFISGAVFMLGFIWVAFDPHHQGWHDKIAGTYVVRDS